MEGKVVFVSGVGSVGSGWGNGRAVAVLMARQGARIFGTDVDDDAAAETARLIHDEGGVCVAQRADATDTDAVAAAVAQCMERFGRIDVLVNNVGGSAPGGPATMTKAQWDAQVEHNLTTCFLGCHHVLPIMLGQGSGVIVNLSSVAGIRQHVGRPQAAYAATKAAIIELSRSIAIQHATDGIRCNAVVPGLMHTPLVDVRLTQQLGSADAQALHGNRAAKVPMGRQGDAWDVAHAVLFLASDEASYITAHALVVDGGISAVTP
jgi:NAD(P)-dependent dehydrogenase (short-subunit alcohol dehydrogenase family)